MTSIRAAAIAHGATVVRPNDTAERRSSIAVAQLYLRYRRARSLHAKTVYAFGIAHSSSQMTSAASNEAWNSLQAMKALLWTR